MEFKFYKGNLNQEPLNTIHQNWLGEREIRNIKLKAIFDTMPFYDGWEGSENSIFGIVCKDDETVLAEVKATKGYKVEICKGRYIVRADRRYKAGKVLSERLDQARGILQEHPSFSRFTLKKLGIFICAYDANVVHFSAAGIAGEHYISQIPIADDKHGGDKFPEIPECLTEIKESEFLALQGK